MSQGVDQDVHQAWHQGPDQGPDRGADRGPRHAVVTGGNRGIGLACSRALAAAGYRVTVVGRDPLALRSCGFPAIACDVTDEAAVLRTFGALGDIDVLINNAGASMSATVARTTLDEWNEMLAVNATSVFLCSRAVAPGMVERGWGRIVTVASVASLVGAPYIAAYAASKHAALGLVRALAAEVAGTGVTANAVCPSYVRTEMTQRTVANIAARTARSPADAEAALLAASKLGRLIEPDEVAAVVARLCADATINGAALSVPAEPGDHP